MSKNYTDLLINDSPRFHTRKGKLNNLIAEDEMRKWEGENEA